VATKIDVFRFGSVRALTLALFEASGWVHLDSGAKLKKMGFQSPSDWKKFQSGKKTLSKLQQKK
jgi:hypothetical protein